MMGPLKKQELHGHTTNTKYKDPLESSSAMTVRYNSVTYLPWWR